MARGDQKLGKVRSRTFSSGSQGWYIDFGRRWAPRFLYSYRGIRFETRDFAVGVLSHIQVEVAKSRFRILTEHRHSDELRRGLP